MVPNKSTMLFRKQIVSTNPYSFWRLLLRCFEPSSTSLIVSTLLSLFCIGINLLFTSMDAGTLLPGLFGEQSQQWTEAYTTAILQPVETFSNNNSLNTLLVAASWGILGWVLYAITSVIVSAVREYRGTDEAIYIPNETHVVHHPLRRMLVARLLWRLFIIVVAIAVFIQMMPLFANMALWSEELTFADSIQTVLRAGGKLFAGWMLTQYAAVVLLRLYLFRTRVFGEIVD